MDAQTQPADWQFAHDGRPRHNQLGSFAKVFATPKPASQRALRLRQRSHALTAWLVSVTNDSVIRKESGAVAHKNLRLHCSFAIKRAQTFAITGFRASFSLAKFVHWLVGYLEGQKCHCVRKKSAGYATDISLCTYALALAQAEGLGLPRQLLFSHFASFHSERDMETLSAIRWFLPCGLVQTCSLSQSSQTIYFPAHCVINS